MARRKPKATDTRGPLQRVIDREAVANDQSNISVITPEMEAKGTYTSSIHPSQGRRFTNNHDPVERWRARQSVEQ